MSLAFDIELDTCGLNCPLPILKAKKSLTAMTSGQVLKVMATDPGIAVGDVLVAIYLANSSTYTYAGETLTATGLTTALTSERSDASIAIGDTMRLVLCEFSISAGPATSVATFGGTASGSAGSAPCGPAAIVRLREASASTEVSPHIFHSMFGGGLQ